MRTEVRRTPHDGEDFELCDEPVNSRAIDFLDLGIEPNAEEISYGTSLSTVFTL